MTFQSWLGVLVLVAYVALVALGRWAPKRPPPKAEVGGGALDGLVSLVGALLCVPFYLVALLVYLSPLLILIWLVAR